MRRVGEGQGCRGRHLFKVRGRIHVRFRVRIRGVVCCGFWARARARVRVGEGDTLAIA